MKVITLKNIGNAGAVIEFFNQVETHIKDGWTISKDPSRGTRALINPLRVCLEKDGHTGSETVLVRAPKKMAPKVKAPVEAPVEVAVEVEVVVEAPAEPKAPAKRTASKKSK